MTSTEAGSAQDCVLPVSSREFAADFGLSTYSTGAGYVATPLHALELLQELAALHSLSAGVSVPELMRDGRSWVILSASVRFGEYPVWPETLHGRTFVVKGRNPVVSDRRTVCGFSGGRVYFEASSEWAVVSFRDGFPSLVPVGEYADRMGYADSGGCFRGERLRKFAVSDPDAVFVRRALWADCDINSHVNNIVYLRWALDALPEDFVREKRILGYRIYFSRETRCGESVDVKLKVSGSPGGAVALVQISDRACVEVTLEDVAK